MKRKLLLLLTALMLLTTGNAWGYDVPSGYEIKKVFVGTNNGDNTVTPENFSTGTYDSSVFGPGTCYHVTQAEKLKVISDYSYVALPDVGESVGDAPYPTYVGANGKVLQWHSRSNATQYGTIAMDPVSTGKLVFGVDLNFGGYNTNYAPQIIFVDGEGNNVLQLGFNCGSGANEYFQFKVGAGSATNDGTVGSSKLRGKYTGHSIRDIVIDMETGSVVYTVDCIGTDGKRQVNTSTRGVNIGTGKTIAGVRLSRNFAAASQSDYIWADNIELYTVGVETPPHSYTINAVSGGTTIKELATGSVKEYVTYSTYVPKVIEYNSKFYVLDDNDVTNYEASYVMGASDVVKEVNYTLDESIVGFSEVGTGTNGSYSSGGNTVSNEKLATATVDAGVYIAYISVVSKGGSGTNHRQEGVFVNDDQKAVTTGNINGLRQLNFMVTEDNSEVYVRGLGSSNYSDNLDYVIIRKVDTSAGADVTCLISNPDMEISAGGSQYWQEGVKDWGHCSSVTNYRHLEFNSTQNPDGAFTGTYAYENWRHTNDGGLAGQMSQTISNIPNGIYRLQMAALVRTVNGQFIYGKSNGKTYKTSLSGDNEKAKDYSVIVVVEDNQLEIGLDVNNTGIDWAAIDNARLTYMPTDATVSATIGSTGWTTFASPYALNLNGMSASTGTAKAYYASSVGDNKIVMTSTNSEGVAAGTGLMLKGTAGATVTIPVAASGDAISGNMLVGCTTLTEGVSGADKYVLVNNGEGTAEFQNLGTHSANIPAGKAYLNTADPNQDARLAIVFEDDDPTAINAVEAVEAEAGALKDGKYLIGNKIVLVKNGVKYSANGQKLN